MMKHEDRSDSLRHLIRLYRSRLQDGIDADIAATYLRRIHEWENELVATEIRKE